MQRPITLLTDFGLAGEYVGVCHGVIARIAPAARVIDLSHGVPRHDVQAGALTLARALLYLPVGIHVAIVDPGVGGERRALALALADGRILVGPDNGLLWPAARLGGGIERAVEISESPWRLEPVSATFHGRDVFSPVAAMLAAGESLDEAGAPIDPTTIVALELPQARREQGELVVAVVGIDEFGNAQLGARAADLELLGVVLGAQVQLSSGSGAPLSLRLARTFADVAADEPLLHEDSAGWIAVAVNRGSAAERLALRVGDELRISV